MGELSEVDVQIQIQDYKSLHTVVELSHSD